MSRQGAKDKHPAPLLESGGVKDTLQPPCGKRRTPRTPQKRGGRDFQFVHFKLSGSDFGIHVEEVREIIPYGSSARGLASSETQAGFAVLRGISIPLVDIRKRFSLPPPASPPSKILIVGFEGRIAGIIADEVIDVEYEVGEEAAASLSMITASEVLTPEEITLFDSPYVKDDG